MPTCYVRSSRMIAAAFGALCSVTASQAATYLYEGNPYTSIFNAFADARVAPYESSMRMRMRISFDLPSPIAQSTDYQFLQGSVTGFRFSDGVQTLDQSNASLQMLTLQLDGAGNIGVWQILAVSSDPSSSTVGALAGSIASSNSPDFEGRDVGAVARCQRIDASSLCGESIVNSAFSRGTPGVWRVEATSPTPIPVPASLPLLAGGLLILAAWSATKTRGRQTLS